MFRGEIWSRHENESEKRNGRAAAGKPSGRDRRFDIKCGFYAVFVFILEHHLHYILNFRDDFSGRAASRGLTTWDLSHRAGPAPKERAPRPSSSRTSLQLAERVLYFVIPSEARNLSVFETQKKRDSSARRALGNDKIAGFLRSL
jgi:hypothetical protein